MRRLISGLFLGVAALTLVSWLAKGRLPERRAIESALLRAPRQEATFEKPFEFDYKGRRIRVRPVASYELHGLVVSHNNIESIADIYHDSSSVDTKDLCVVWGRNLESDDYRKVRFRSGSFTCYFSYPRGVRFSSRAASNNHLITSSEAVREAIADVKVGDQVRLEGLLVDYQMDDWRDFWRSSSTVRSDDGCEVIFVRDLEVLRRATPGWYRAFDVGRVLLVVLPLLYLLHAHLSVREPQGASSERPRRGVRG